MKVTHCPTGEMWAGILTKPLQERAFRLMRSKLMNCSVDYEDKQSEEEESRKQRIAKKTNQKLGKSKPVTGRMSLRAPTQTLQECVGRPQLLGGMNRRLVGVPRIQERVRKN